MLDQSKPVYQRLRDVIANAILDGSFGDGDMLPSVRSLAAAGSMTPSLKWPSRMALAMTSRRRWYTGLD